MSVLALSALTLQRVQNRMLIASADVQQAQLNAEAAIELGLLAMKQDENWRTTYTNGAWFSGRGTGVGTCTLQVVDPVDGDLDDSPSDPVVMTGIGSSGSAVQRVERTVDPYVEPLDCLRSSVAAGDAIGLTGTVLRATNSGLVSANSTSASASTVYGTVQAVTVSGSTYSDTTTQIAAADLPEMPDWQTVFDYYRTNGTEIIYGNLPQMSQLNLGKNVGFESGTTDWTGSPTGVPVATITQSNNFVHGGSYALRISGRTDWWAGAAQYIDGYVKPGQQYYVEAWVYLTGVLPGNYYFTIYTKGTGNGSANTDGGGTTLVPAGIWTRISGNVTAQSWSGPLEYAFVKFASADSASGSTTFYLDDVIIRETTTGRFIYRQVLGPGVNPIQSGATNAQGIYWINCAGNKLVIERSRIKGTLLVVNPGSGSCIGAGPINWSPAVAGYPALLVDADIATDADFAILATNRSLSETENSVNYNPTGANSDDFGQDADTNDIYPSQIQGLIAVEDDLTYQNNALVRGQLVVGDDISATSGTLEVDYRPDSLLNPPPGFAADPAYVGRPSSVRKTVLP